MMTATLVSLPYVDLEPGSHWGQGRGINPLSETVPKDVQ